MINFKNINIEGFGSIINPTDFILNRRGLNIISGKVGSGKTSIPSALVWCLYGQGLKGKASIQTWEELRPDKWNGTKVDVNFIDHKGDEYHIIRCLSYNKKINKTRGGKNIFIIKNGVIEPIKGKVLKQIEIIKILGYSYDLFINAIIFGQRMKRIIDESGPNKKKIFEEAFEVQFIEEARKVVVSKNKDLDNLSRGYREIMDKSFDKVETLEGSLEISLKYEKLFKKTRYEKIKSLKKTIKKYKINKKENNKIKLSDLTKAKNSVQEAKAYKDIINKIIITEDEETEIENTLRLGDFAICKTCGSSLSKIKRKKIENTLRANLKILSKEATILREKQFLFPNDPTSLKKAEKKLKKIEVKLAVFRANAKHSIKEDKNIVRVKKELVRIKDEKLKIKSKRIKYKIKLANKRLAYAKHKNNKLKGKIDINKWLIKEPLSNTGLKAYIFDSLLNKVNNKLSEYSEIIGFNIEFGIDLESVRKDFYQVITKNEIIITYADLSGGQKQLVDTCIALAIHSVISSVRPVNLMFLDEPFEGLDDETIEIVSDLIVNKSIDKSIYLITHHASFNPITANKIYFKLSSKGYTKVS